MTTALKALVTRLEQIPDDVARRVDTGFNSFPHPPVVVTKWNEYTTILAAFYAHIECAMLRSRGREVDKTFDWGRCQKLLVREWGESGDKAGFELARTGNEGGMLRVLRTVARRLGEEAVRDQISILVHQYWATQSAEELLSGAESYVQAYEHLLPAELTETGAVRIKAEFIKVLKEHPHMMRRMRNVGR